MKISRSLAIMILLTAPTLSYAHARWKPGSGTPPRNDSTGLKTGPCGAVPRLATPKIHKPGEEITVEWEETINHPGFFVISFSKENDTGFEANVLQTKIVDTQDTPISTPAQYHSYSIKVKLPNVTCTGCTLQLQQHMDDNPGQTYFSCTDIQLVDGTVTTPAVTPTTAPTTTPAVTPTTTTPTTTPSTVPATTPVGTATPGTTPAVTPAPASPNVIPTPGTTPAQKPAKPTGVKIENTK